MSDEKMPAADPEIPGELRSKLFTSKRPKNFMPKNPEATDLKNKDGSPATPPEEVEEHEPLKDLTEFFEKLAAVKAQGTFFRKVKEWREVKRKVGKNFEFFKEERTVNVPVALNWGDDGLPYLGEAIVGPELHDIRSRTYPDAPKMDPRFGDLTPEFSEWLYLNHPVDAAARYFARQTHISTFALNRSLD